MTLPSFNVTLTPSEWSHKWHLPFNANKRTILHFFTSSTILTPDYFLNSIPLTMDHNYDEMIRNERNGRIDLDLIQRQRVDVLKEISHAPTSQVSKV